jgi:tetratricopeptide (TPR) repeat protein
MAEESMNRRWRIISLMLMVILVMPLAAWSQESSVAELTDSQRADLGGLFAGAQRAFEQEAYGEAIVNLERAYDIFPEPNILYRIGDAYEQQGRLEEAVKYYVLYVEAAPDATDVPLVRRRIVDLKRHIDDMRQEADAATSEAPPKAVEAKLAVLIVDSNPAGARVHIGDEAEPRGVTPARFRVEPGDVHIQIDADGHRPLERVLRVEAGETLSMVYPLQEVAPADGSGAGPWVIGGVGVAALATGGGLLLASQSAGSQLETYDEQRLDAYGNGGPIPTRPADYDELTRQEYYFGRTGWAMIGVGAVGVGAGIAWLAVSDEDDAQLAVVPGWGGASVVGWF